MDNAMQRLNPKIKKERGNRHCIVVSEFECNNGNVGSVWVMEKMKPINGHRNSVSKSKCKKQYQETDTCIAVFDPY